VHPVVKILEERREAVGREYVTDWVQIDQMQVDVFGAITRNLDPMHNDPKYVKDAGVWNGRTVLHGLFTASLIPHFLMQVPGGHFTSTDTEHTVNYGMDKVRWTSPVYTGIPIRARVTLLAVTEKAENRYLMTYRFVVEQEGNDRPCMIADNSILVVAT
jgi:acyl dehydratase